VLPPASAPLPLLRVIYYLSSMQHQSTSERESAACCVAAAGGAPPQASKQQESCQERGPWAGERGARREASEMQERGGRAAVRDVCVRGVLCDYISLLIKH
jgi:hypothetical protein